MRQLMFAPARCGSALFAWPPSSSVATQVVRSIEQGAILVHHRDRGLDRSGPAMAMHVADIILPRGADLAK